MNKPVKYAVALIAGVAAVGAVAVVALPILARSASLEAAASLQQVVPTVVDTPDDIRSTSGTGRAWQIDADSSVGYRMRVASDMVVDGSTSEISGMITRTDTEVTDAEFMLDLSTLTSDSRAHDTLLRALVLATGGNSTASFVLTQSVPIDPDAEGPQTVPITGVLTVRGVSTEVTAEAEVEFDDESGTITGSLPVDLERYGISLPDLGVVSASDTAYIDVDLVTSPAG